MIGQGYLTLNSLEFRLAELRSKHQKAEGQLELLRSDKAQLEQ